MEDENTSLRYAKGMEQLHQQFGTQRANEMIQGLTQAYPFFAQVNVEFPFADIYTRNSVVDLKTREIATVAALTVQGFSLPELRIHLIGSLKAGVTREELLEIITQMIAYAGFPAATNAILLAKKVFDEIDSGELVL